MAANKGCVYATDEEIKSMTVKDLKDYLQGFGQFLTGKKPELIEQAMGISKLKLVDKMIVEMEDNAGKEVKNGPLLTLLDPLCEYQTIVPLSGSL